MPATTGTIGKTIDLADLLQRRVRTVEIDIGDGSGETFWVKYKPDALTKEMQREIRDAEAEDTMALILLSFLADWSLTVDGKPFPITAENLEALGLPLQMAISAIVQEDFNNQTLGKATSNGLPPDSSGS